MTKTIPMLQRGAEKLWQAGKSLGNILSLSLADERIAPGECLSVHLDRGGIDVAYGVRFLSRIKIKGTRHYPFEADKYPGPEVCASTIHLALTDLNATQADVTLVIPKAWTILKTVDLPSVVKKNLAAVVGYELDRLTPFSPGQAYYDFGISGEDENRLQIILAAVKAESLDPYLRALKLRDIQVKQVIDSLSALGALSRHVQGEGAVVFLRIKAQTYEGGLLDKGWGRASFTGSLPAAAESEQTRLLAEEVNTLVAVAKKEGKAPPVLIEAAAGAWPLLPEQIQAPVRFLAALDLKLPILKREPALPTTAIGGVLASLQHGSGGLNLLAQGVHKAARTPWSLTIFLVACLAALGLYALAATLQVEEQKVAAVERAIAARAPEVRQIETMKKDRLVLEKEIATIEGFKAARPLALNVLKELTQVLPKNTWLTRIHLTDRTVDIEGNAVSSTDLLPKLEASRYFKKVEFASPTFRDARMNAYHFSIKMEIEGLAEDKEKNAKKQ